MFELQSHRYRAMARAVSGQLQGDDASTTTYVPGFVDLLLQTPLEDGEILPDKNLHLVLIDLLNAGTETSATAVEYAMAEMIREPEVLRRLQDELDTVIGSERGPQEADLPNLSFLEAVVKETFCFHPPLAINLLRESTQEIQIQGSYELTPFSAGHRMCPAHHDLGNMMVSLVLAHLAHSFDWSLPEGVETPDMSEKHGFTVSLKNLMRLKRHML